jgi:hypothetical protein
MISLPIALVIFFFLNVNNSNQAAINRILKRGIGDPTRIGFERVRNTLGLRYDGRWSIKDAEYGKGQQDNGHDYKTDEEERYQDNLIFRCTHVSRLLLPPISSQAGILSRQISTHRPPVEVAYV